MKSNPLPTVPTDAPVSSASGTSRRRLVVGAGVAAGAAVAVAALQRKPEAAPETASADGGQPPAQGYRMTDHIRRYYETTRS